MTTFTSLRMIAASASLAVLAACGGATEDAPVEAAPAGDAPPEIEQRQANFEAISDSFKAMRAQLEGGSPDLAVIEASANDINARAMQITGLFPSGSGLDPEFDSVMPVGNDYDTEALPSIWEQPEEFEAAAQELVDASAAISATAAAGDAAGTIEGVKGLGMTCKGCHDKFRLDDD